MDRLKILGSRRGAVVTFGVAGLAVVAAGAFAASQVVGRPAVDAPTPAPGSAVASATPTISFDTAATELTRLSVSVDGTDVSELARSMDGRVVLVAPKLGQGEHTVSVSVESPNLIKGSTSRTWSFAVDTVAPKLKIATPKDDVWVSSRTVKVAGTSEPGATVRVAWEGGSVEGTVGDDGKFSVQPKLADGPAELQITVTDAAGNVTTGQRRVLVDSVPPKLGLSAPGDGAKLEEDDRVVFEGAVPNEPIETLTVGATVNGK